MRLAKTGQIKNVCLPNALMTLSEYAMDYGDDAFRAKAEKAVREQVPLIASEKIRAHTTESIGKIHDGGRDYFI